MLLVTSVAKCTPLKLEELPLSDKQTSWRVDTGTFYLLAQEAELFAKRLLILILVTNIWIYTQQALVF